MKMKMVNGVITITDGSHELVTTSMREAFYYLAEKKFCLEMKGALPTDRKDTVTSLIPPECRTKTVRYSIEGVPV